MDTTKYKTYDFSTGKVSSHESYPEDEGLLMPFVGLEDSEGKELYLYDVLLDEDNEGWILGFHEMGYLFLERIGSDHHERLLPVMDVPNFDFGQHYYRLPMKYVGNAYVDHLHNSSATPRSSKNRLMRYLIDKGLIGKSDET